MDDQRFSEDFVTAHTSFCENSCAVSASSLRTRSDRSSEPTSSCMACRKGRQGWLKSSRTNDRSCLAARAFGEMLTSCLPSEFITGATASEATLSPVTCAFQKRTLQGARLTQENPVSPRAPLMASYCPEGVVAIGVVAVDGAAAAHKDQGAVGVVSRCLSQRSHCQGGATIWRLATENISIVLYAVGANLRCGAHKKVITGAFCL